VPYEVSFRLALVNNGPLELGSCSEYRDRTVIPTGTPSSKFPL
jgi:hypothetical protein